MIDGFSLIFFLPLTVHDLVGLTTSVTGVLSLSHFAPKLAAPSQRLRAVRKGVA